MLKQLHVENVAVIEELTVTFQNGFVVLTGETGAGKSVLIDAINIVLGERASKELIRTGEQKAFVSAVFVEIPKTVLNLLSEYGLEGDGDELLISREIAADGRSTARVAGRPVTAAILREIGAGLVTIHGQHDNQMLLSPERHIEFIDTYCRVEKELSEYKEVYNKLIEVEQKTKALKTNEREKARKTELLKYQADEIDAAHLLEDEEEGLFERRQVMQNGEKLASAVVTAYDGLYAGDGETAKSIIDTAASSLMAAGRYSNKAAELSQRLAELSYSLDDITGELRELCDRLDFTEEDINAVERRLDIIYRLKQKYGGSIAEILQYGAECRAELESIEHSEEELERLYAERERLGKRLAALAERLSDKRREGAARLEKEVERELAYMDMAKVRFEVRFTACDYGPGGAELLEFMISANAGEEPRPLSKIASGGELSRIMLALRSVFAGIEAVPTLIFDEIDSGVSGGAAQKIGLKMKSLAKGGQVFCVTHLSQIAALADSHYKIYKTAEAGRTYTRLAALDLEGRVEELARIISGVSITKSALENAREMLGAIV